MVNGEWLMVNKKKLNECKSIIKFFYAQ